LTRQDEKGVIMTRKGKGRSFCWVDQNRRVETREQTLKNVVKKRNLVVVGERGKPGRKNKGN